jgi:hypothetical protein
VVVEILDVPQVGHRDSDTRVQVGCAVPGNLEVVGSGQGRSAEEFGDAAAAGHVQLEAIHGAGVDEPRRVGQRPAVLSRGHIEPHLPPYRGESSQILRGNGLLEPGHPVLRQPISNPHCLRGCVAAVGVHVECGIGSDDLAGQGDPREIPILPGAPAFADLDLHPRDVVLLHPADQLVAGLLIVVAGETAAAVDRDSGVRMAEQLGQRAAEEAGLEIPQRDVHRRDGGRGDAGAPDVPHGAGHGLGRSGHVHRVAPDHGVGQHVDYDALCRGRRITPADALGCPGSCRGQHHRGLVPGEGPVGLGRVGGDDVSGGRDFPHDRPVVTHR